MSRRSEPLLHKAKVPKRRDRWNVFAGGLEEDGPVYSADSTGGDVLITDGPYVETKEWLGGFALVDVADDEAAKMWAGKIAEACGWPHEVRRFKPQPKTE